MPEVVRDVLDYAVSRRASSLLVDIMGTNENTDVAVARTTAGFRAAIVSYNATELEVMLRPTSSRAKGASEWTDLVNSQKVGTDQSLKVRIPSNGFRALEFRVR